MLKGTLLSHNSGCQVSERRLWDCASFSLGLFNWLCYCRSVPGEDSKKEARLLVQKIQSFLTVTLLLFLSRDTLFTAALYGEGDLALDPSEVFPKGAHPHMLSAPPLSRSSFCCGYFLHHNGVFCSLPLSLHPFDWLSRELLIRSTLQISTLFSGTGGQHLFGGITLHLTHTHVWLIFPHWLNPAWFFPVKNQAYHWASQLPTTLNKKYFPNVPPLLHLFVFAYMCKTEDLVLRDKSVMNKTKGWKPLYFLYIFFLYIQYSYSWIMLLQ